MFVFQLYTWLPLDGINGWTPEMGLSRNGKGGEEGGSSTYPPPEAVGVGSQLKKGEEDRDWLKGVLDQSRVTT